VAAKNFFLLDALASGSAFMALQDGGGAPATATTGTGWTVGKTAAGNFSRMDSQTERSAATFTTTPQPNGAPDNALGDSFRTPATLTGSFASGNWTIPIPVIAVTNGGDQDGRIRLRLWRSTNQDGSSATEITGATQLGTTVTNLTTTTQQISTVTFNPGAFSLAGEYLFFQLAWEITGAGGNNGRDVLIRIGASAEIVTSDFSSVITGTISETESQQTDAASGSVIIAGELDETEAQQTDTISGAVIIAGSVDETEAEQTDALSGAVIVAGSLDETESEQTDTASGSVIVAGSIAEVESEQTDTASGVAIIAGTVAETQAEQTDTITGTVVGAAITGSLVETQAEQTDTISAAAIIAGAIDETQEEQLDALSGAVLISGSLVELEAEQIDAISGAVVIAGALVETEAQQVDNASAVVLITATIVETQSKQTDAATGAVLVAAIIFETQSKQEETIDSTALISGSLVELESKQEDAIQGAVLISGSLVELESEQTEALTGSVGAATITGSLVEVQSEQLETLSGSIIISGALVELEAAQTEIITGTTSGGSYVYDVATQTANGRVTPDVLFEELIAAGLSSGGAFGGITVEGGSLTVGAVIVGGTLTITWSSALSASDEADQDAVVAAHQGPMLGPEIQQAADESISSTALTLPQQKVSLVATPLPAGDYLVLCYCEIRLQTPILGAFVVAALNIDAAEVATSAADSAQWRAFAATRTAAQLAGATPTIALTFRRNGDPATVEIRRARIGVAILPE
jgi:hypothetical protein